MEKTRNETELCFSLREQLKNWENELAARVSGRLSSPNQFSHISLEELGSRETVWQFLLIWRFNVNEDAEKFSKEFAFLQQDHYKNIRQMWLTFRMLWSKSHKNSQNNAESLGENASSAPRNRTPHPFWGVIIIQFDSMVEPPTGVSLNQDRIPTCPTCATCLRWTDMWHPLFYGQDFYCSHLLWATSQATNVAKVIFYPFFDMFFYFSCVFL